MARRPYLSLWRRKRPSELRLDHGLLEDLGAFIADRIAPRDDDERRLADALQCAGGDRAEAALALATRCTTRREPPGDLAMTLTLFAALELSEPACLILAQALDGRAKARLGQIADIERSGGSRSVSGDHSSFRWPQVQHLFGEIICQ